MLGAAAPAPARRGSQNCLMTGGKGSQRFAPAPAPAPKEPKPCLMTAGRGSGRNLGAVDAPPVEKKDPTDMLLARFNALKATTPPAGQAAPSQFPSVAQAAAPQQAQANWRCTICDQEMEPDKLECWMCEEPRPDAAG